MLQRRLWMAFIEPSMEQTPGDLRRGMTESSKAPCFSTPLMTAPSKTLVDAILREKYPMQLLADTFVSSPSWQQLQTGGTDPATAGAAGLMRDKSMAGFYALKAQLEAMPAQEVARLAAASTQRQQTQQQAKAKADADAREAARFYNRPEAKADFAYWCKVEFWTLDEAVVLLLGRNPHVVTPEALAAELSRSTGLLGLGAPPPKAAFHGAYERLRTLMLRAEALASPRLKPGSVVAWAIDSGAVEVPTALAELAVGEDSQHEQETTGLAAESQRVSKWTANELAEMRRYKEQHGTKATAEKYGISEPRVRKLCPTTTKVQTAVKGLEQWARRQR